MNAIAWPGSSDYPQFAWVSLWNCVSFVCVLFLSLLCGWGAVEKRETEQANMSKTCYRRRSKMKHRGSKIQAKMLQNPTNMTPKWLPGGLWADLGRRTGFQSRVCILWASLLGRSWRLLGSPCVALGAAWASQGVPGGSQRVPGRVPESLRDVILEAFLLQGLPAREK